MPVLSLPIVGSVNYFRNGQGDGAIVMGLALVSLVLTFTKRYKWLLLTGMLSTGMLAYTLFQVYSKLSEAKANMESGLEGNPFKGLATIAAQSVQLEWGWAVMLAGAVMLIVAAVIPAVIPESLAVEVEDSDRQPCLFCAEEIKVEATVCRFCGKEQPGNALPAEIKCPSCESEIVLDSKERLEREFTCAVCAYQTGQTMRAEESDPVQVPGKLFDHGY
jgi:hypothetical protein